MSAEYGDAVCKHCHDAPVSRPRGLCWSCYFTPGVRGLYPPNSRFVAGSVAHADSWKPCPKCGDVFHPDSRALTCSTCAAPKPVQEMIRPRIRRYAALAAAGRPIFQD